MYIIYLYVFSLCIFLMTDRCEKQLLRFRLYYSIMSENPTHKNMRNLLVAKFLVFNTFTNQYPQPKYFYQSKLIQLNCSEKKDV